MKKWYFPRRDLAKRYLNILQIGISPNIGIVAQRRKGKTMFLLEDVAALAKDFDFIPVYASLWQNINRPEDGIILALKEVMESLDRKFSMSHLLHQKIKKVGLKNELLGKLEVEFANKPEKISDADIILIDQLLTSLMKKAKKKKILLMLDEIQHLATNPQFDSLAYALRTMLDKRGGEIKTIMTGSSRHYMHLLFNKSQSPFYHFVEIMPFPDLDAAFLSFIAQKIQPLCNKDYPLAQLQDAFNDLDGSPYWMMKAVSYMIAHEADLGTALTYIQEVIEAAEDFEGINLQMKPIDKIVFMALSQKESPFAQSVLDEIEQQTDVKGIVPNVQRSLQRLISQHIISQVEKGAYIIEKPGLKKYLLSHPQKALIG